jgi:hypothetical protein
MEPDGIFDTLGNLWGRDMAQPRGGKQLINESHFPYIVELVVPDSGLEFELARSEVSIEGCRGA